MKKDYTVHLLLFCLLLAVLLSFVSCSPKINITGTAIQKHYGSSAVTTTFKTMEGKIFLKRGFQSNTYELGKSYSFKIRTNLLYTQIR